MLLRQQVGNCLKTNPLPFVVAGSNPTPVASMASVGEQNRAFWHEVMWSCGDEEFERAVRPVYANVNPQTALGASIDHMRLPCLSKLASISTARLSKIQPDASRGRACYLVLVSDSYTVFPAGKNRNVDLAGDLIEQMATGVFNQYPAVIYHPMWGKTLPVLVAQAVKCGPVFATRRGRRRSRWTWPSLRLATSWLANVACS